MRIDRLVLDSLGLGGRPSHYDATGWTGIVSHSCAGRFVHHSSSSLWRQICFECQGGDASVAPPSRFFETACHPTRKFPCSKTGGTDDSWACGGDLPRCRHVVICGGLLGRGDPCRNPVRHQREECQFVASRCAGPPSCMLRRMAVLARGRFGRRIHLREFEGEVDTSELYATNRLSVRDYINEHCGLGQSATGQHSRLPPQLGQQSGRHPGREYAHSEDAIRLHTAGQTHKLERWRCRRAPQGDPDHQQERHRYLCGRVERVRQTSRFAKARTSARPRSPWSRCVPAKEGHDRHQAIP